MSNDNGNGKEILFSDEMFRYLRHQSEDYLIERGREELEREDPEKVFNPQSVQGLHVLVEFEPLDALDSGHVEGWLSYVSRMTGLQRSYDSITVRVNVNSGKGVPVDILKGIYEIVNGANDERELRQLYKRDAEVMAVQTNAA